MSDTRTDRDPYAIVTSPEFVAAVEAMSGHEKLHPRAPLDSLLLIAWESLASGFARRIPRASSIAVPHTPEEIWAFADLGCDVDFWKSTDLEYTDDGVTHLASNVSITPDDQHMPDELRPDIGDDRVESFPDL